MPIDAVWMVATVPQKSFEQKIISFQNKLDNVDKSNSYNDKNDAENRNQVYMEKILEDALLYLNIQDSVWISSKNGHYYHVYFTCELDNNDHTMHYLKSRGIGSWRNSAVGYIPFGLFYYNEKPDPNDPFNLNNNYFNEIKDNFLKSVTARLTVAQVVDGVKNGASISFDYYMYLFWASVIAAMAIMNDQDTDIAASMMIEPLMGSVMAVSFGLAILNKDILITGLKSLFYGLIFCLIFGYIYGLIFQIWRVAWNPGDGTWPTSEMVSRGQYRTLIYGAVIATAGGAVLGVCLLRNNIVALTGVAVATTFMPPFVNAGLCFALATHLQITGNYENYQTYNISGTEYHLKPAWAPPPNYETNYVVDMRIECSILAVISLAYTFVNVFFLFFASFCTLKAKEIVPLRNLLPSEQKFFNEDLKIYKAHQKKYSTTGNNRNMGQQILEEWADLSGINKEELLSDHPEARAAQLQTLYDIANDVEQDANYQTITRHAFGNKFQSQLRRRLTQPTIDNTGVEATLRNTPLNNLGVYTVDENVINSGGGGSRGGPSSIPHSAYASIRRSFRSNPLRYSVNSPYSVWPVNQQPQAPTQIRHRSRSSSTISGQIYGQINNDLSSSKL